jgi:hypothetical protein
MENPTTKAVGKSVTAGMLATVGRSKRQNASYKQRCQKNGNTSNRSDFKSSIAVEVAARAEILATAGTRHQQQKEQQQ